MKEADKTRFATLLSWARQYGADLHPLLEVYKDDVTGFSMRVKPDIKPEEGGIRSGDRVLTCPLKISLSYLNATAGGAILSRPVDRTESIPVFPAEFMKLKPHVIGRFYLIKQYLMGKTSFWHPYIATLPQPDNLSSWSLPVFWPEEDAIFLEGTNTGVALQDIQARLRQEFKQARKILKESNFPGWQDYSRILYNWAFSIFTSRSFRPSLVVPQSVQELECPREVSIDDFSILLPVYDIINHSQTAKVKWEVGILDDHVCRLRVQNDYGPGDQIFNTYGIRSNSELLLAYGFIIPETEALHNDYYHLRKKQDHNKVFADSAAALAAEFEEHPHSVGLVPPPSRKPSPHDFLVSLRPMNHPSSLVGKARQIVARDPSLPVKAEFACIEDSLIWDMCTADMRYEEKAAFIDKIVPKDTTLGMSSSSSRDREVECLRRILTGATSEEPTVVAVEDKVKGMLAAKLRQEYEKLCETDPVMVDEDGREVEVVPQNERQRMALVYRTQCKKVLENAIAALA